ncbi:MAG: PAS domain-containing protein [Ruminococcus flavefaciens]|jgi:PAS domain-containing protein|nr:PAS domain-containing protein [Ruminococcus flavefaciens]
MELNDYFRLIIDNAERPIVICNTDFRVIYTNKKAEELYESKLKDKLLGTSVSTMLSDEELSRINAAVEWFKESPENNKVFARHSKIDNADIYLKVVRDPESNVIGFYNYMDYRNAETGKEYDLD